MGKEYIEKKELLDAAALARNAAVLNKTNYTKFVKIINETPVAVLNQPESPALPQSAIFSVLGKECGDLMERYRSSIPRKALAESVESIKAQLSNAERLTAQELEQMNGQPVWWVNTLGESGWGLVSVVKSTYPRECVVSIRTADILPSTGYDTFVAAIRGEMNEGFVLGIYLFPPQEGASQQDKTE